jgi:nitrile hydratase
MNGIHDLGGMHGFGPIEPAKNADAYHASWELHVVAINEIARRGYHLFNLDEFRHGIERMAPIHYLEASYHERWLASIETLLIEKGIISREELDARTEALRQHPDRPVPRRDDPAIMERLLPPNRRARGPDDEVIPRFAVGTAVITRNLHPPGHTRLPRYARGKRGVIDRLLGAQVFADDNAHGRGRAPQMVYSVRFTARELWGDSAEANQTVNIDLWESYLTEAEQKCVRSET